MRVEQFLRHSASRLGDKTALVAGATRLTFGELDTMSDRLAGTLISEGVVPGDRVIVFMENCWQAVVAIFAVFKAGAVLSPVNPSTKSVKLGYLIDNCRATAIVTQARLLAVADAAIEASSTRVLKVVAGADGRSDIVDFEAAIAREIPHQLPYEGSESDLAMLVYTSGSTGLAKGVMMTHRNVANTAESIAEYLENTAEDVVLGVLPISFGYGLYQVLVSARVGATLVLEKSFAFPNAVLRKMAQEQVTGFPLVPTMAAMLLKMADLEPGSLSHLRYITSAGANLPPAFIEPLRKLFPTAALYSMYGLTECQRCTWLPPSELARRPTSVGIAIPGAEAWVIDENGQRAKPGTVGELVIQGPQVMKGYWEDEAATARVLRPAPNPDERILHTGDLFRADEDGFFYFVARMDDIIVTGGEKVSPKEVENVLHALPEVREAAVLGVPDPVFGMAIKAVLVTGPGSALTEKDVIRHCARHLEDFMRPKTVEFREHLPKTDSGKISRRLVEKTLEIAR